MLWNNVFLQEVLSYQWRSGTELLGAGEGPTLFKIFFMFYIWYQIMFILLKLL